MSKNQDLGELINGIKSLGTNQLNAPAYTSATSFTGTLAGLLGFDSSGNIITTAPAGVGVTSFNTRTGAVTLSSSDVTGALGYTPYDTSNPAGYITGINSGMVTSALGYTPVPPSRTITINGVTYDLSADRSWTVSGSGVITGSGTNNYVTKWTGTTSIGIGNIQDTGTLVSINSETYVNGTFSASKTILYGGPEMIRMYASSPFISFYDATNVTRFGYIQAYSGLMEIVAEASNPFNFNVGGSDRMRILTNGNIGIGTTSPSSILHLNSASGNGTVIRLTSTSTNGKTYGIGSNFVSGSGEFAIYDYTAGAQRFFINTSGNIGIGTTTPSQLLEVNNATQSIIRNSSGTRSIQIESYSTDWNYITSAGQNFAIKADGAYPMSFFTNGTERMRILSTGRIAIGMNYSDYATVSIRSNGSQVFEGLNVYSPSNAQFVFINHTGSVATIGSDYGAGGGGYTPLAFIVNNTEFMRIVKPAGYSTTTLAIRTTSPYRPNAGINVYGNLGITSQVDSTSGGTHIEFVLSNGQIVGSITSNSSNTTYSTSSDYRLKYDYQDLQALDLIDNLKIYQYKWKVDNAIGYGVMAHELQEYIPYAVTGKKDGKEMQAVDYSKLAPIAIAGVKQLNKLFESHAEKIARLESEVAFLKSNIA